MIFQILQRIISDIKINAYKIIEEIYYCSFVNINYITITNILPKIFRQF